MNADTKRIMRKRMNRRMEIFNEVSESFEIDRTQLKMHQIKKLRETLLHVFDHCQFYQNRMISAGINRRILEATDKLEDIQGIPFTTRKDIHSQYPFGLLSSPKEDLIRYGESTGTTDQPINSCYTYEDWFENNCIVAYYLSSIISPADTVAVIVPYGYALVGQDVDRALELVGANIIAIGTLSSACPVERVVRTLINTETTVLVCSPSRAIYLGEEIRKAGYNPAKDFCVNRILCVGEGTSEEKAKRIKEIWNAECYPMFGMTETNTLAMPCVCKRLHLTENKVLFEVIDPYTLQSLGEDVRGELVVTSFVKGIPLIRYRTGDLVTIHSKTCECGASFRYLEHHGRLQDCVLLHNKKYQILDLEDVILKVSHACFYTLKVQGDALQVGLVVDEDKFDDAREKVIRGLKEQFDIDADVMLKEDDKIMEIIRNKVKPSISSVLEV